MTLFNVFRLFNTLCDAYNNIFVLQMMDRFHATTSFLKKAQSHKKKRIQKKAFHGVLTLKLALQGVFE